MTARTRWLLPALALIAVLGATATIWPDLFEESATSWGQSLIANLRACPDLGTPDPALAACREAVDQMAELRLGELDEETACTILGLADARSIAVVATPPLQCLAMSSCPQIAILLRSGGADAVIPIERCIAETPYPAVKAGLYARLARILVRQDETEAALETISHAVALDPRVSNVLVLRALLLAETDAVEAAYDDIRLAREIAPHDPHAASVLCQIDVRTRSWADAEASCTEAVSLGPTPALDHFHRACARYGLQDYERAMADMDLAIKQRPRSATAFGLRALVGEGLGDSNAAARDAAMAVGLGGETEPDFERICRLLPG